MQVSRNRSNLGEYLVSRTFKFQVLVDAVLFEDRGTGAPPHDVWIIVYLNDLGLFLLSPDPDFVEKGKNLRRVSSCLKTKEGMKLRDCYDAARRT